MKDLYKAVEDWVQANPPVEDPQVSDITLKRGSIVEVWGKSIAITGNRGQVFFRTLAYDIVDDKIRVYEKVEPKPEQPKQCCTKSGACKKKN